MHEVSLIEDLVALVTTESRKQRFARVRVVRVSLGAFGPAEPEALHFCFDAVVQGTIAEGARLEIETVPGMGWCMGCSREVPLDEVFAACPVCGLGPLRVVAGQELRLAELEVD